MRALTRAPDIAELKLFDSCVTLGRVVRSGTPESVTVDNVLGLMDKHDIAEAVVHHHEARLRLPRSRANEQLLRDIEGIPRLHPAWVLHPPDPPGSAAARALVEEMLSAGVRVARLMMGYAPPLHWMWQDLCAALEEHRVPCLLDFGSWGYTPGAGTTAGNPDALTLDQLRDICVAHPDLPMVLSHVSGGLGLARPVLALMRRVTNLHLDITSVTDYWTRAAKEIGPERAFFATGMPFYDPSIFVSNVQYDATLGLEAKRMICGDNLRALMEAVR